MLHAMHKHHDQAAAASNNTSSSSRGSPRTVAMMATAHPRNAQLLLLLLVSVAAAALLPCTRALQDGTNPPGVPAHSASYELPCFHFFMRTLGKECTPIASAVDRLTISHCRTSDNEGVFVIASQPTGLIGQDVYRVRIAGPEIVMGAVHYCPRHTAYVPYTLTQPGSYDAEFLHLYSNFTYELHPPANDRVRLASTTFSVAHRRHHACTADSGCEPCGTPAAMAAGRWMAADARRLELHRACLPGWDEENPEYNENGYLVQDWSQACPIAYQLSRAVTPEQLRWQPYSCSLPLHAAFDFERCRQGRYFCFAGDSQLRTAYNTFANSFAGKLPNEVNDFMHKRIKASDFAEYFYAPWGKVDLPGEDPDWDQEQTLHPEQLEHCTDVLFNFGQWPASYHFHKVEGGPQSASGYGAQVAKVARFLQLLQKRGKRVWWLTNNEILFRRDIHAESLKLFAGVKDLGPSSFPDYRTDPVTLLYNKVSSSVMQAHGVPVMDVAALSNPLNELSYDATHYIGNVGYFINLMILHSICPAPGSGGDGAAATAAAATQRHAA